MDTTDTLIEYVTENKISKVIIMSGAGISTNSGVPDFRSPGGIFSEIQSELKMDNPELLFTRDYFDNNEDVGILERLKADIFLERLKNKMTMAIPTHSHILAKKLNDIGILKKVYTQNIDGLYQKAGVPDNKIVEFHGSYKNNNVVLYGDEICKETEQLVIHDLIDTVDEVDLLLVMGTSLQVAPFCALPNMVRKECCRVLIDICPENAYDNSFSKQHITPYMYSEPGQCSYTKFGKHKVTLRQHWNRNKRWKTQYIIEGDTDIFSKELIKYLN